MHPRLSTRLPAGERTGCSVRPTGPTPVRAIPRRFSTAALWLITVGATCALTAAAATATRPVPTSFGRLPLAFEKNSGQTDARFQFVARGAGHSVYLAPDEAVVAIADDAGTSQNVPAVQRFLRFALVGARAAAAGRGDSALPGRIHRLTGSPSEWTLDIVAFAKVRFDQVYPGIDLVYHGNQSHFEYDFVVAPGADPSRIALQIDGAREVRIDANGDLAIAVGDKTFRQHRPVLYQIIDGKRREISGQFVLKGRDQVAFAVGAYDRRAELIIDPVLSLDYSTYLGGAKIDRAWAIQADASGNAYVAGDTLGVFKNVPASGFQTNSGGGTRYGGDAFVAKLDPTGTNYIYFTYLGGNSLESANGLAIDPAGAAYVTGFTTSTNFPVIQAAQPSIASGRSVEFSSFYADAFVTKLDSNGVPVYSTYLGGELDDVGGAIAVDAGGNAYVTGYTDSIQISRATYRVSTSRCTNNITLDTTACGPSTRTVTNIFNERLPVPVRWQTNFVRRYTESGETPTTNDVIDVSQFDLLEQLVIAVGFPTVNAVQTNNAGGARRFQVVFTNGISEEFTTGADMFVTKISPDGASLAYSTYLGGAIGREFGTGIGVDAGGNAIVCGVSDEDDFPVANAFQAQFGGGGRDAIVAKFDPTGASLLYSTYLGGSSTDVAYGLAVDAPGNAYIVGSTSSRDFLSTPGQVRPGGVFKSVDGSANWSGSSAGFTHTGVRALAINPASPSILFAATPRGVFLSTDGAGTWAPVGANGDGGDATVVAIEPTSPGTVYAAGPNFFARSDDSGTAWVTLGTGLPFASISSIVFDPANPSLLYAGTRLGFYASTNRGTNFVRVGKGLQTRAIHRLAMHPSNSSILYAATDGGVFQSTNAGLNWRAMNTGLATRRALALAINPSTPGTLITGTSKGLYRSTDAGTNWVIATNGLGRTQVNAVQYDPSDSAIVYAGATNGIFRSADGGLNWTNVSTGLVARDIVALANDPTNPSILYSGARGTNYSGGTNDAFLVKLSTDGATLNYAFTFGGSRTDEARAVAVDGDGSAFVTGLTLSRNFPVVSATNRWQTTNSGRADAFIAQFDSTGTSNVFSIHLGGKRNDAGHAIALDGQGGIYVAGATDSKDFVTTNALKSARSGEKLDAFVTKLTLPLESAPRIFPPFVPRPIPGVNFRPVP